MVAGLVAVCLVLLALAAVVAIQRITNYGKISVDEAREFHDFPVYWLGHEYRGLPLSKVENLDLSSDEPPRERTLIFTYGDEQCTGDYKCTAPIKVWVDHYCQRPPWRVLPWENHLVSIGEYHNEPVSDTPVRGVTLYRFGRRSHLWAGSSAVMIDVDTTAVTPLDVADDLIPMSQDSGATREPLAAPVAHC